MLLVLLGFAQFVASLKVYLESKICFSYSGDGHLYGAWSSSLRSSTCLVASRFRIAFWHSWLRSQLNCMSIAFVRFGCTFPLVTASAIALSVLLVWEVVYVPFLLR